MKAKATARTVEVSSDGEGLGSRAGTRLLAEIAERSGLTAALCEAMAETRERRSPHDPGAVLCDLAVAIADGGDCVSDLGVLRGQAELFGSVASECTAHRVIGSVGAAELVLDIDATLDETGEPLAALLRPGNAGANTAADHFEVLGRALEQLPASELRREITVRTDAGGASHAFLSDCRAAGIGFSVGYELTESVREAILARPQSAWQAAIEPGGEPREGAWVSELSGLLDLARWPEGTRLICRRERAHPGAQLSFTDHDGHRFTCVLTDSAAEDIAALELRHRRRARVEDRIRTAKDTGMESLPFHSFPANEAWLELSLTSQDLLVWMRVLCLEGELALAEPKRLRRRLLHVAARIARSGRRTKMRLPRSWPWAQALVAAFARLRALPLTAPL